MSNTIFFHVLSQQRHPGKAFGAASTSVLLVIGVGLQMRPQIGSVRKSSVTMHTRKRLLPSVSPDVSLQQPRPRKSLATNIALARQRVSPDVHLQRSHGGVHFFTILTDERLLGHGLLQLRHRKWWMVRMRRIRRIRGPDWRHVLLMRMVERLRRRRPGRRAHRRPRRRRQRAQRRVSVGFVGFDAQILRLVRLAHDGYGPFLKRFL